MLDPELPLLAGGAGMERGEEIPRGSRHRMGEATAARANRDLAKSSVRARGEVTLLEQDGYIQTGKFPTRTLKDLLDEFSVIREATIALVRSLDAAAWQRRGTASQKQITSTALAFIIAGHVRHHRILLEERYLSARAHA